jgi:hypothetical protein
MAKIDLDALTKDFVTNFFPDFISFSNPALYHAVDWIVEPVFLEQEMLNMMKGRYRIKGKRRNTDKLVKLRLLDGTDHFVLVHIEFQHQPQTAFGKRMFTYFALTFLRYDTHAFTAIAFFTGHPPVEHEITYRTSTFGTDLTYQFNTLIAANQDEDLLVQSKNPVALGILAMIYALKSEGNPDLRLQFKKNLFHLAAQKGISREILIKLLIFVRDFVHLPPRLENIFMAESVSEPITPEKDDMIITKGTKKMVDRWYEDIHGFSPLKEIAKIKRAATINEKKAAAREAAAREAAAREAAAREAAARETVIFNLYKETGLSIALLAKSFNCTEAYIQELIKKLEGEAK